jgi:hypothetical protein
MLALPGLTLTNNVPDKVSFKEAIAVMCNCHGLTHHPHNPNQKERPDAGRSAPVFWCTHHGGIRYLIATSCPLLIETTNNPPNIVDTLKRGFKDVSKRRVFR